MKVNKERELSLESMGIKVEDLLLTSHFIPSIITKHDRCMSLKIEISTTSLLLTELEIPSSSAIVIIFSDKVAINMDDDPEPMTVSREIYTGSEIPSDNVDVMIFRKIVEDLYKVWESGSDVLYAYSIPVGIEEVQLSYDPVGIPVSSIRSEILEKEVENIVKGKRY